MNKPTPFGSCISIAAAFLVGCLALSMPSAVVAQTGDALPSPMISPVEVQPSAAPTDVAQPANDSTPPAHRSIGSTAAKILDAISKHPEEREGKIPDWRIEQDKAVEAARAGHYEQALPMLEKLRQDHPKSAGIAADYAAILGWAGRDADAVAAYKTLPPGDRPDYLIDSVGHSYRNLHQPQDALEVYRAGLQTYPDNQSFTAGEILSLFESGDTKNAKEKALAAALKYQNPSNDLTVAIRTVLRADAVALARAGQFKEALAEFIDLHTKYPTDTGITGDYVVALSWAGHDTEAVTLYQTIAQTDQPDYVLDAAAHSYRSLRQPQQALNLYQAALAKNPDNVTYAVGTIYSLSDLGRDKEALALAEAQLAKHPEKPEALVKAYSTIERRRAIDLARAGHYEQALIILRQLRAKYPSDITEEMDYIAVSSWAGHDSEATKEYRKVAKQPMPDYVLEAVGASYRRLHMPEKALAVYRRGLKQSPGNEVFAAGEIRCLDDLKRYEEGEGRAKAFTSRYGSRLEVLLAGGEASMLNEEPIEGLNFYERANGLSRKNREALRGIIQSEDRLGAAHLALDNANKHPGLMKGDEYRAIVGDADSTLVRWGPLEPASEATRYAQTDQALVTLDAHINQWKASNDPNAYPNILRARFDRLIALRDRVRMQEVINEYNALVQEGVEVPAYALGAVGEAYLYLRQPETARDIFLKILESDPTNFEARRLLAYSYLECNQYDESYTTIDKLAADEPEWIYLKGEPERQPNPSHAIAETDAGEVRAYSELLQEADDHLTPIVQAGPFDARNRVAAGNVYMQRGWPRKALEQYQIGLAIQDGHDVALETGIANANLALQNFAQAEAQAQNLFKRFPENQGVQRLNRDVEIYNMAEVDAHAGYNFAPSGGNYSGQISHGQGFDVGAELYSSPILYNWRLFAGEDFAHEHEPNAEGIIDYWRSNAGVEYRNGDVTASLAPTLNHYTTSDTNNGPNGDRVGVDGVGKYTFNDMWTAGIAAELFASETPLRALDTGITANRYDANALWRQSESRQLTLDAYVMTFSDKNLRTVQNAEYIQRLYTDPTFKLDAEGNLASSQNSRNQNALYYNPSFDLTAMAGLRATQTLYHHYETLYEHSLLVMPGAYNEQHHGTSIAGLVRYEQRVHYNDTLNAGAGINYAHQEYDGTPEDAVSLTVDVVERF